MRYAYLKIENRPADSIIDKQLRFTLKFPISMDDLCPTNRYDQGMVDTSLIVIYTF